MGDWRAELERERHMVPSQPLPNACARGPTAQWEGLRRLRMIAVKQAIDPTTDPGQNDDPDDKK